MNLLKTLETENRAPAEQDSADVARASILLVDDQPSNLLALEGILSGLERNLVKARSGVEALRCLLKEDFALILLDVRMPVIDGFETAALIRQRERSQHTPIIFLTAHDTDDLELFKGYSLGAVDYLRKPIVPEVLRSKVAVFVDIFQKTDHIKRQGELLRRIQQQEHERQLADAKERLEAERLRGEIRIARQVQQKLFPTAPVPLAGFDISGASYPAEATGGDYFDYIPMPDGSLGVVIGDVSGHGFGPALLMAQTRAYLRAFMLTRADVGEIIGLANQVLFVDTPEDRFVTLLLAQIDPKSRSLVYANAGHPPGYLLDASGEVKGLLASTGIPLAIMEDAKHDAVPAMTLETGDIIFLMTDGILEANCLERGYFGIDRALEVIRAKRNLSARQIVDALFGSVRHFCQDQGPLDDMTVIVIKVESGPVVN